MVNDDVDSEHGTANLDKSGAGDTTVQKKQLHKLRLNKKILHSKTVSPWPTSCTVTKTQRPTSFSKLCHPTALFYGIFCLNNGEEIYC